MKHLKFAMVATVAIVAAISSGFTTKGHNAPKTVYYFANVNKANPPGTNDFLYQGVSNPGISHCTSGVPICYGSSSMGPDANNHPSGGAASVTTLQSGNWKN